MSYPNPDSVFPFAQTVDHEMLSQREQLMEDIDGICDDFFCQYFPNSRGEFDDLVRELCDAVCKNFPCN